MHLAQGGLDAHVHGREIGVRRHDANDAAGGGVEADGDDTQHDILARENAGDGPLVLHQDSGCAVLLHQLGSLANGGPDADSRGRGAVEDGLEGRARHLGAQRLDVLNDLLGLTGAKLGLDTLKGIVEASRGGIGALELLHGVVEALCNVEDTGNILVLVHDGQMAETLAHHEIESIGGARVGTGAERVLGHDIGDRDVGWLHAGAYNAEGQILGSEDTRDSVVVVGDENTVLALSRHELGCLGDGRTRLNLQGGTRFKGEDGAGRRLSGMAGAAAEVLLLGEVALHLATDGLDVKVSIHHVKAAGSFELVVSEAHRRSSRLESDFFFFFTWTSNWSRSL